MLNVCSNLCLPSLQYQSCLTIRCVYTRQTRIYKHSITTRTGLSWTSARKSTDRQLSTRLKLAMRLPQKMLIGAVTVGSKIAHELSRSLADERRPYPSGHQSSSESRRRFHHTSLTAEPASVLSCSPLMSCHHHSDF